MTTVTTRPEVVVLTRALFMSIEQGERQWKLGFVTGLGQPPRVRTIPARSLEHIRKEIALAKERFGLPQECPVYSVYEAGREGFWVHWALKREGVENQVLDSASIEVNRRARRAKTDKLDARKLVVLLVRYHLGERNVCGVVRVPSPVEEDRRQLHRALSTARRDRTRVTNRIKALLALHGVRLEVLRGLPRKLRSLRAWDGTPLPEGTRRRLEAELEKAKLLDRQIHALEVERKKLLRHASDPAIAMVRKLMRLCGIGVESAWVYTMEFFAWRKFTNVKQLGSLAGLAPTPHQSGELGKELGITKAGNRHVRALAIEIAWIWTRLQPESALTLWFERRYGSGGPRRRKVGIVALARKLLIALWKYVDQGVLPEGAVLKR